jgi:hypothetical protein
MALSRGRKANTNIIMIIALMLLIIALALASGCTDRTRAGWAAYGDPHIIELYSGGRVVATFESTGKVECTEGGICDFMDKANGKLVRTTGDVVIRVK